MPKSMIWAFYVTNNTWQSATLLPRDIIWLKASAATSSVLLLQAYNVYSAHEFWFNRGGGGGNFFLILINQKKGKFPLGFFSK